MKKQILFLLRTLIKAPYIVFAFCYVPFITHGQFYKELENINSDSLQSLLPQLTGKDQINALNKIALSMTISDPDSAIKMAEHTISLANNIHYKKGVADAYYCLGRNYSQTDSLKNSVYYLLEALRIYESLPLCEEMGHTLNVLGAINMSAGRFKEALQYEHRRLNSYLKQDYYYYLADSYYCLSGRSLYKEELDSATYYGLKALEILKDYPDNTLLINTYVALQAIELWRGDADPGNHKYNLKSVDFGKNAIEILDGISGDMSHYSRSILYLNVNLAEAYIETMPIDSSNPGLPFLYTARKIIDTTTYLLGGEPLVYSVLGHFKSREGDYKSAIQLYLKGIKIADERMIKFPDSESYISYTSPSVLKYTTLLHQMWSYDSLYAIYFKLKNFEKALEYFKLKEEKGSELKREDKKNLIAILEAESDNEKTEKQIAMLERDKQINELKVAQSRNLNIGLIAVFVILLIVGILFIRQNKLKNEHKSTLLEQKLLRLQMNPHFIFNALSSIHSLMNPKDVSRASGYLGNFSRVLRSSLESSREDYILLEEEISSLKNYLELQQLRYEKKFDFKIDVDPKIDLESAILPPMLLQPFIENAIEHGIRHKKDLGNIFIRFKLNNKKITCEIEDDGVGREKAWEAEYAKKGKHKSLATEIIQDRIKILNKKLKQKINLSITDLRSEANGVIGTMVRLDLPYLLD